MLLYTKILKKKSLTSLHWSFLNYYTKFQPMTISLGILRSQHALHSEILNYYQLSAATLDHIRPHVVMVNY